MLLSLSLLLDNCFNMSKGLIDPTYNIHKTKLNYPKHAVYEDIETEVSFMKCKMYAWCYLRY